MSYLSFNSAEPVTSDLSNNLDKKINLDKEINNLDKEINNGEKLSSAQLTAEDLTSELENSSSLNSSASENKNKNDDLPEDENLAMNVLVSLGKILNGSNEQSAMSLLKNFSSMLNMVTKGNFDNKHDSPKTEKKTPSKIRAKVDTQRRSSLSRSMSVTSSKSGLAVSKNRDLCNLRNIVG